MNAIESRLTRLENQQAVQDAEPWRMIELRPAGDGMWRDDAGSVATIAQHEAAHSGPVVFVLLAEQGICTHLYHTRGESHGTNGSGVYDNRRGGTSAGARRVSGAPC